MKFNQSMTRSGLSGAALLMLVSTTSFGADYPTSVLAEGPLAYWRFNETATSPALNEVANSGSLGSAANGYIVLDVGKGEAGRVGDAIRLVNTGNVVGYCGSKVDVPFHPGLNPQPPFSVEFWAKPNLLGGDATGSCPLSSFDPNWYGGGNRSGWLFYLNNSGQWQFRLGATSGYAGICTGTGANATIGTWQHIVATYDGTTAKLYADGVEIGSAAAPVSAWSRNTQMALRMGGTPLYGIQADGPLISASGIAGNRGYDGWIDEVAVYPSVLSPATIAAHFQAASTNTADYGNQILADSPLGYWNLNEPAVTAPDPSILPIAANSGTRGSSADATNMWGSLAGQPGPAYGGFGPDNHATFLNSVSGHLVVRDDPSLHLTGNVTMMAWIKPTVQDFFRNIIAQGWDADWAETFLRISRGEGSGGYGDDNYYEVGVTDGVTFYDVARFPIPETDIGNWIFLAGTYDGSSWNLYRNGVLVDSVAVPGSGALDVGTRWTIGSRVGPPSPTRFSSDGNYDKVWAADGLFFGGWIDEPAIFNKALSAATIGALYNAAQVPPVITSAPEAPTGPVFSGASLTLSVGAEGGPPLSYLWTLNGVSTGVTTPEYTASNLAEGSQLIAVEVSNPYGAATNSVTIAVISAPPSITQQPLAATWYAGRPFSFSVTANGSLPLGYQWKLNGTDITGAISSTYSGVASAANAGNYTVRVSNSAGQTESDPAALVVLPVSGDYKGTVISDSPLGYWRLGETNGSVAYDYYGGHHGTYYSATLGQAGYSAFDTDTAVQFSGQNSRVGDISGTEINFTGHTNFSLEAWVNGAAGQPDQSTILVKGIGDDGTTATEQFSLDVSGGKFRFFVRRNATTIYDTIASVGPDGNWHHVVAVYDDTASQMLLYVDGELQSTGETSPVGLNATTTPFTIGSKRLGNDPNYAGTFSGTIDEVAVYSYALTAEQVQNHYGVAFGPNTSPQIRTQPQEAVNYVTLPISFSVSAFGSVPLSYQWKKDGQDISGANSFRYSINSLSAADAGDYTVTISNGAGSTNSAPAKLTVLPAPTSDVEIPGLVVHLPFNGNLTDTTARGNNGSGVQIIGTSSNSAPVTYLAGKLGQALHYNSAMGAFPGPTETNTSYVTLGVRPDLQFSSNVNFTVAFWIKLPLDYIGGDLPFFTTTVGSTFGTGLVLAPSYGAGATAADTGTHEGGWAMSVYDALGNGVGAYGAIGSLNDGEWHHLVYVFDRNAGSVTYLDGRLATAERQAGTDLRDAGDIDTGNPATIGQDPTGTYGETGSGDMDDFGVWRKALTPLEAASIYMAGMNGLSFMYVPPIEEPTMTLSKDGTGWRITYAGTLQSSGTANAGFTDVPGASSPYTLPTSTGTQQFYRSRN